MQRVRGCANAMFRTAAPQGVGAARAKRLWVLVLLGTPSLIGEVRAEGGCSLALVPADPGQAVSTLSIHPEDSVCWHESGWKQLLPVKT